MLCRINLRATEAQEQVAASRSRPSRKVLGSSKFSFHVGCGLLLLSAPMGPSEPVHALVLLRVRLLFYIFLKKIGALMS